MRFRNSRFLIGETMPKLNPPHPGLSVLDGLVEVDWTVTEFADRLEISEAEVTGLLNGERGISPKMALALERLEWGSADFWIRLQAYYDLAQERRRQAMVGVCSKHSTFDGNKPSGNLDAKGIDANQDKRLHWGAPFIGNPPISAYLTQAMECAEYEELEDGTFSATIPPCVGVIAFGKSLRECYEELRSTLEDWLLMGLKLGHPIPPINGIDLNKEPKRESLDAL